MLSPGEHVNSLDGEPGVAHTVSVLSLATEKNKPSQGLDLRLT